MPAAFPIPIPAWVKGAWHTVDTTLVEPYVSLLQYLENLGTSDQWRRLQVVMHNTSSGAAAADDETMNFDILNITGGLPDATWTTTDYTTCEGKFDTFFTAVQPRIHDWLTISQYRWYIRSFNPLSSDKDYAEHGPPVRIQTKTTVGSNTSNTGAQQAITITKKTAWSKHWGRNYLPQGGGAAYMAAGGRLTSTECTSLAAAYGTLVSTLAAADFQLVVPVIRIDKVKAHCLMTITGVQVDDILDVIRRRRPRNATFRAQNP